MSTNRLRTLDQLELNDQKTVLCRVDFNVPLRKDQVADDTRIRAALPTIQRILETGAKLVLCSHMGRPKGTRVPSMSLLPVAVHLQELLDTDLVFSHDTVGDAVAELIREQPPGSVILLENLRFDEREKSGDDVFARELSQLADVFVNDAFGAMHRSHASITGVANILPSAAGLLVQAEVEALARL
ncbi:MAG: phosphoglycerate kinase, partial [Kiritimatiellia bacterium]